MAFCQDVISSTLLLFLMALSLVVIMGLFLTLLNLKYLAFERDINNEQAKVIQTESIKTIQKRIKELNEDLSAIKKIQDTKSDLYGVLDKINEELFKEIKIYNLEINNETKAISVAGLSLFRENLVKIRNTIEKSPHYQEIDFPLSNLANPRDINFRFSFKYIP